MRIVIDMQGAQAANRFRGIGRYTLGWTEGVIRHRGGHEIFLALNGHFPDSIEAIRAAFDGLLPQENIRVWDAPAQVAAVSPDNEIRRQTAELVREAFLASLQPDVIHITSLFEGYGDDAVTSIARFDSVSPVSVTLYDLIPLLNPKLYLLPNPDYAGYYGRKIGFLKKSALLLAISESSRQEGLQHLGVDAQAVVNVSTAIGAEFQPTAVDDATADALREKFGLTRPFVLYTGGADQRKNLTGLIEAYAALPKDLRQGHQLVFVCKMNDGLIDELKQIARKQGMGADELCFTGYVSDEALILFYRLCRLFVFPSWHEGFGLPALEAMACGAPVIGANTSSLPEVIGEERALFDPFDVQSICNKMTEALRDEDFRKRLRAHGLQQAGLFSWDETARRSIAAWEKLFHTTHP
ncbi:hypothetical protein AGMMS50289_14510 [Betaproteobacteria bacterium]|nr:hypothetical protein AGMMS50289_14510 [Betaproteobacteria bacterium]